MTTPAEVDNVKAAAERALAYAEDSCMSLPSGPCKFENDVIKVCEYVLAMTRPDPARKTNIVEAFKEIAEAAGEIDEQAIREFREESRPDPAKVAGWQDIATAPKSNQW